MRVGEGGVQAPSGGGNGDSGNVSWFNTTGTLLAMGGRAGNGSTTPGAGIGGNCSASIGTTCYPGGNGGYGNSTVSGAGGGGAGTTSAGGSASGNGGTIAGTGGSLYGGVGANGVAGITLGLNGAIIGGGGSGGSGAAGGGAGGRGQVIVTSMAQNAIFINIYNESTGLLITGTNFTVSLVSDTYTTFSTTITGTLIIDNLPDETYTLTVSGTPYTQRQYVLQASNNSTQTLNAYMTTSSSTTLFQIKAGTGPDAGLSITGATVTWETIINATYVTVESRLSDVSGTAGPLVYIAGNPYRATITKNGYTTKQFLLNPVQYTSYDIYMTSNSTFNNSQDYEGVSITYTPTSFYPGSNPFTFIISSPDGRLTSYNYTLTYPGGTSTNSSTNAYGSTLTSNASIVGATTTSTVTINYCYTTSLSLPKCFSFTYGVKGVYATNNTIDNATRGGTGAGDLESTGAYVLTCAMTGGAVGTVAGPLGFGIVFETCTGIFKTLGFINIWVALFGGFVGLLIIAYGMTR